MLLQVSMFLAKQVSLPAHHLYVTHLLHLRVESALEKLNSNGIFEGTQIPLVFEYITNSYHPIMSKGGIKVLMKN